MYMGTNAAYVNPVSDDVQHARRPDDGHRVVTVQVDSGLKYLHGSLFADS